MGLDAVEIILAIEDKFGISISDEEATDVRTPGELTDLVIRKLEGRVVSSSTVEGPSCATQRAFHLLRAAASQQLGTPRRVFRLETQLESIVPQENRETMWFSYGASLGARSWPELHYSSSTGAMFALAIGFTFLVSVWCLGHLRLPLASLLAVVGSALVSALVARLLHRLLGKQRVFFRKPKDVRGLVEFVASNPQLLKVDTTCLTRPNVRDAVRRIICEQMGIGNSDFSDDSDFVNDIGVD